MHGATPQRLSPTATFRGSHRMPTSDQVSVLQSARTGSLFDGSHRMHNSQSVYAAQRPRFPYSHAYTNKPGQINTPHRGADPVTRTGASGTSVRRRLSAETLVVLFLLWLGHFSGSRPFCVPGPFRDSKLLWAMLRLRQVVAAVRSRMRQFSVAQP